MRLASILGATLICGTACWAPSARAATIVVNTVSDSIADNGRCSLREAVTAANTGRASGFRPGECLPGNRLPIVDVIQVPAGIYKLQRGHSGENRNLEGDLDITESVVIQGVGRDDTIIRNAVGDRRVRGDGDRLIHADPAAKGGVNVTLRDLTIGNGDVGCSGEKCSTGASAIEASGNGALTLDRVSVQLNSFTCSGIGCGARDNAAIRAIGGGGLTILRSVIKRNRAFCKTELCNAGTSAIIMYKPDAPSSADFVLEKTLIKGNSSTCDGAACATDQVVDVHAREVNVRSAPISQNKLACSGPQCGVGDVIALKAVSHVIVDGAVLEKNAVSCLGEECGTGGVVLARGSKGLEMGSVTAKGNTSRCEGTDCGTAEQFNLQAEQGNVRLEEIALDYQEARCTGDECGTSPLLLASASGELTVADAIITNSATVCTGAGCYSAPVLRGGADKVTLARGQLLSNGASCEGDRCATNAINDLYAESGGLAIQDTSIESNTSTCFGDECYGGGVLTLVSFGSKVVLERSALTYSAGLCGSDSCYTGGVLYAYGNQGVDMETVSLEGNLVACGGASCNMDQLVDLSNSTGGVDIDDLSVDSNVTDCAGRDCAGSEIFYVGPGAASSIRNANFEKNVARCSETDCTVGHGGALRNSAPALTVSNTTFNQNDTEGYGAAIFNDRGSELILDSVFMFGNRAGPLGRIPTAGFGGAIYNYGETGGLGVLRITNSEIRGNQAAKNGGGILNQGAIVTVTNTIITSNTPNNCANVGGTGCP